MGPALVSRSARRRRRTGERERRGGGEEREEGHGAAAGLLSTGARAAGGTVSAGPASRPHPRGGPRRAGAAPGSRGAAGRARLTPTASPPTSRPPSPACAGAASGAGRPAEGCSVPRLPGRGSCSPFPTDPSSLSSSILSSSSLSSLPPLRLLFCEWIRGRTTVRGTRLVGVSPSPTPAGGFAPVRHQDAGCFGPCGSAGPRPPVSAGPASPSPAGSEGPGGRAGGQAQGKKPQPRAQVSHPAACGPGSRAHLSAVEAAHRQPCKVSGVDWRRASLAEGFLLQSSGGRCLRERPPT